MAKNADLKCADCTFFHKLDDCEIVGQCHRFPPVLVCKAGSDLLYTCDGWERPFVQDDDYCGEFKPAIDPRAKQLVEKYESLPKLPSGRLSHETMALWDSYLDEIGIGRGRAKQLMREHMKK